MTRTLIPVEDRFYAKVDLPADKDGCWLWTAVTNNYGYGRMWMDGKLHLAHRISFELFVGEIPDGMTLDHECHNADLSCPGGLACQHRRCVNPDHLEIKTQHDNVLSSKWTVVSMNAAKTHCLRGHEFTPDNTHVYYSTRNGLPFRSCKQCEHERYVKRQARLKGVRPKIRIRSRNVHQH